MRLALFDLDGTLLSADSEMSWTYFLSERGLMNSARAEQFYQDYLSGSFDIDAWHAYHFEPLVRLERPRLLDLRAEWMELCIRPRISQPARDCVIEHRDAGHEIVLVTASHSFLCEPIAEEFGMEHVLSCEVEEVDGQFTGKAVQPVCFGAGKLLHLDRWVSARGISWDEIEESWAYSDSPHDLPLLERCQHRIAVDPKPALRKVAEESGWPVKEWAKSLGS